VDWLLLAALGIMWVAFLMPVGRRRSDAQSVEEFERRMELLAQAEVHGTSGRWIVTPRKGVRFLGPRERERARARGRRRRVFVFLIEAIGLSFLIGLVPPLRAVWMLTAVLGVLLVVYVWLLLAIKQRATHPHDRVRAAQVPTERSAAPRPHLVAELSGRARPSFQGMGALGDGEPVHVVVKPASTGA
jgi:Flp pilus assembly protein TadB